MDVYFRETPLLVNICTGLAVGLMQPWVPTPTPRDVIMPSPPPGAKPGDKSPTRGASAKKRAAPQPAATKNKSTIQVTISNEATPDLKRALEVRWLFFVNRYCIIMIANHSICQYSLDTFLVNIQVL